MPPVSSLLTLPIMQALMLAASVDCTEGLSLLVKHGATIELQVRSLTAGHGINSAVLCSSETGSEEVAVWGHCVETLLGVHTRILGETYRCALIGCAGPHSIDVCCRQLSRSCSQGSAGCWCISGCT